jgi:hypothetical protein
LEVVNRLRAGQPVEVSTGYFADMEATNGVWNGAAYTGITRNIRPDHLALLPDEVGACSWVDGCGAPRVNVKGEKMHVNELELSDRIELVRRAFWKTHRDAMNLEMGPDLNIVAIFDGQLIAKDWMSKGHLAYPYALSDAGEVTFSEPVTIEVVYRAKDGGAEVVVNAPSPGAMNEQGLFERFLGWLNQRKVTGISNVEEEHDMTKADLVTQLVANAACKFSRAKLEGWEEADLQALSESLAVQESPQTSAVTPPAQSAQLPPEITAFAQMIANLGGVDKLGAALGAITANADQERAGLVAELITNAGFTEEELATMPTATLRKLNTTLMPRDFSLAGGVLRANFGPDEEELVMPYSNGTGGTNGK